MGGDIHVSAPDASLPLSKEVRESYRREAKLGYGLDTKYALKLLDHADQMDKELAEFKKRVVKALGLFCHGAGECNCQNKSYRATCHCYACQLYRDCQETNP